MSAPSDKPRTLLAIVSLTMIMIFAMREGINGELYFFGCVMIGILGGADVLIDWMAKRSAT